MSNAEPPQHAEPLHVADERRAPSSPSLRWSVAARWPNAVQSVREFDDGLGRWNEAGESCPFADGMLPAEASVGWDDLFSAPLTVAKRLTGSGRPDHHRLATIDQFDWWFDARIDSAAYPSLRSMRGLLFEGLATLAEVWWNGERRLVADNMFRRWSLDLANLVDDANRLTLVFRSVRRAAQAKRPRPRWKTNLVEHQQLRWIRASMLGRIPGWSPPVPAIGPWKPIRAIQAPVELLSHRLSARLDGDLGVVRCEVELEAVVEVNRVELTVDCRETPLTLELRQIPSSKANSAERRSIYAGELTIDRPPLWWPHTHGDPALSKVGIHVLAADGEHDVPLPSVGFRQVAVRSDDAFGLIVNGVDVRIRGACWTCADIVSMTADVDRLRASLTLLRDAGGNMLRIAGPMTYESDEFYSLCDELGLMVWQDLPFANMDYPVHDAAFRANITAEASEQVARLAAHPSLVVVCGNSEVEQQAAMRGVDRSLWRNDWFAEELPAVVARHASNVAYIPSTPNGGMLPFQTTHGVCHYYGVGAYLRPESDVRSADVAFSPECLGFSNLPEATSLTDFIGLEHPPAHLPLWKERVPRDTGAGWDFEDVRDHYLKERHQVDPVALKSHDLAQYYALSRTVPGEMMTSVFSEWRSTKSRNRGGLVWVWNDLWPGAGWGVIDSTGHPKSTYFYLKRVWQPQQVLLTDEGLNGLAAHVINETGEPFNGTLELAAWREPSTCLARGEISTQLSARESRCWNSAELLGGFHDVNYAYRFGPLTHDIIVATLRNDRQEIVSEAYHRPRRTAPVRSAAAWTCLAATALDERTIELALASSRWLNAVHLNVAGFVAEDNYFQLPPGREKHVMLHRNRREARAEGTVLEVGALNLDEPTFVTVAAATGGST